MRSGARRKAKIQTQPRVPGPPRWTAAAAATAAAAPWRAAVERAVTAAEGRAPSWSSAGVRRLPKASLRRVS
jgi:hypothetical protein